MRNALRDKEKKEKLLNEGWKVIVIWECQLKTKDKRKIQLSNLLEEIQIQY